MKTTSIINIIFLIIISFSLFAQNESVVPVNSNCFPKQKVHKFKDGDTLYTRVLKGDNNGTTNRFPSDPKRYSYPLLDSLAVTLKHNPRMSLILNGCLEHEKVDMTEYNDKIKKMGYTEEEFNKAKSDIEKAKENKNKNSTAYFKYKNLNKANPTILLKTRAQQVSKYLKEKGVKNCMLCYAKILNVKSEKNESCKNYVEIIITNSDTVNCFTIKTDVATILKNIYFETNKWDILPQSFKELDKFSDYLKENPSKTVEISGHTDNTGDENNNIALSHKRAESVRLYLVQKGVKNKIETVGYGSAKPIASNNSDEGKAKNRRIEVKITDK